MEKIFFMIQARFEKQANPVVQSSQKRFFKEPVKIYGLKSQEVHNLTKDVLSTMKDRSKEEVF